MPVDNDYGDLILAVARAATKRTILHTRMRVLAPLDPRFSMQPDDKVSQQALAECLQDFTSCWEWAVDAGMGGLPKSLRELLKHQVRLLVSLYQVMGHPAPEPVLAMGLQLELPPLLVDVFPLPQDIPDNLRLIARAQNNVGWDASPLNLYWVQSADHAYDWFVVAISPETAALFFQSVVKTFVPSLMVLDPILIRRLSPGVSTRCHDNVVNWAAIEAIWDVGGTFVSAASPRIISINGTSYQEGPKLGEIWARYQALDESADNSIKKVSTSTSPLN